MSTSKSSFGLVLGIAAASAAATLRGQCGLQWQPGQLPGADAPVFESVRWDPDGAGPLPLPVVGWRQQVVQAEFGATGEIAVLSNSNGLQLTLGAQ